MSEPSPCKLYRLFDADNRLLYVGISQVIKKRMLQHKRLSPWASEVDRVEVEDYPTREFAKSAEAYAILTEEPYYNRLVIRPGPKNRPFPKKPQRRVPSIRVPLYGGLEERVAELAEKQRTTKQYVIRQILFDALFPNVWAASL